MKCAFIHDHRGQWRLTSMCWFVGLIGIIGLWSLVALRVVTEGLLTPGSYASSYAVVQSRLNDALNQRTGALAHGLHVVRYNAAPQGATAICADSMIADAYVVNDFPSLQPGGFLADQIELYNAHRRWQVRNSATLNSTATDQSEICGSPTPSILTSDEESVSAFQDTVPVSQTLAMGNMRVRSPTSTGPFMIATGPATSAEFAIGLPSATLPLDGRAHLSGRCGLQPMRIPGEVAVQCNTVRGANSAEVLINTQTSNGLPTARVVAERLDLRIDGKSIPAGTPAVLRPGSFMALMNGPSIRFGPAYVTHLGAFPIGGVRWINGSYRWSTTLPGVSPFLASAIEDGALISDTLLRIFGGRKTLVLSLDPEFNDQLRTAVDGYIDAKTPAQRRNIWFADVIGIQIPTGRVLGIAEYGQPASDGLSWLRQPVTVGSAIKPILASAFLSRFPGWDSLEVYNGPGHYTASLWGNVFKSPVDLGRDCPANTWITLRLFLACSSNLYAASIVALGLTPRDEDRPSIRLLAKGARPETGTMRLRQSPTELFVPGQGKDRITQMQFNTSAIALGLQELFDLLSNTELASLSRESRPWDGMNLFVAGSDAHVPVEPAIGSPASVAPSRLDLIGSAAGSETTRLLYSYAIGAAENKITLFRLAEAYLRLVTDSTTRVSLVQTLVPTEVTITRRLTDRHAQWRLSMLDGLADVFRKHGTAEVVGDAVRATFGDSVAVVGKTGTLGTKFSSGSVQSRVDSLSSLRGSYARTLVASIVGKSNDRKRQCGLMFVIYFRFRGSAPADHLLFGSTAVVPLARRLWANSSGCNG